MGWGLTINGIYLSRVTKSSLAEQVADAREDLQDAKNKLIALAAASPHPVHNEADWTDYVRWEVASAVETIETATWIIAAGGHALSNPEDVEES